MSAETGFEDDEKIAPFRVSGFVCLLLGMASVLSFVAKPVLIIPMMAIAFGLFALRRCEGGTPVGTTAAKLGMLMAVGFGAYGLGMPMFKQRILGERAEYFAREFIELIAKDKILYAAELQKKHPNRFLKTMSLEEHYKSNPTAEENLERSAAMQLSGKLQEIGAGANWKLSEPVKVYVKYGRQEAEVVLRNDDLTRPLIIQVVLELIDSKQTGAYEWSVNLFQEQRSRIVAESVL